MEYIHTVQVGGTRRQYCTKKLQISQEGEIILTLLKSTSLHFTSLDLKTDTESKHLKRSSLKSEYP